TANTASVAASGQSLVDVWKKSSNAERQKFMAWLAEQAQ
ncbi:DUF2057 domain-containing protein, partial [Acinetobacter baumannii]